MRNIILIIAMTLVVGFVASYGTHVILLNKDKKAEPIEAVVQKEDKPANVMDALVQSTKELGQVVEKAQERDKKSKVAGVIGLVAGLLMGIGLVMVLDRKRTQRVP